MIKPFISLLLLCAGAYTASAGNRDTLRIMTYNIHHCNPPTKSKSGEIEVEAIARVINAQKPDLVALQEVDVRTGRAGGVDQAAMLASQTGMQVYFAKAIDHDGGDYGVAILSRLPLSDMQTIHLPETANPGSEDRVIAIAKVTLRGGKNIIFASTHLDVSNAAVRDEQATEINKIAAGNKLPFILAGDLNCKPESASYQILLQRFTPSCTDCAFTIPVNHPNRVIDHILWTNAKRFRAATSKVINEPYPSDHLPVVAEVLIR
ncbi:endonuclease/exonuclease/phosphatase family protein [Chitinophaga arvensicola]|uniref:Metal-dependent hydrolase, endonuclease/exonuclease/phosphatase family n=1 Tax=Chitinophaga arvensicola TaxID=29529 RepID=A0A1I0S9P4_9BACT|nr:endonuclease/exonuclease/phosphatase family protein [Chitinophaga arvensicola]SEW51796.1 Metal-dependent hydrolase, endonuclease/exonuclease/phosphatase family [Chitinophaga arvensicola]